jgi:hypothetical protein
LKDALAGLGVYGQTMKVSVLLAGLALFFAPMGRADSVLIGNSFVNLALAVSSGEFLAQPLVLTGTASISDIDVTFISNEPNSVFQFEVTNAGRERECPCPSYCIQPPPFAPAGVLATM